MMMSNGRQEIVDVAHSICGIHPWRRMTIAIRKKN